MGGFPAEDSKSFDEDSAFRTLASDLQCRVSSFLTTRKFSDLVVYSAMSRWHVHKLVMCSHSAFIESTCEGHSKDAEPDHIDFGTENEWVVQAMIQALYNGDYEIPEHFDSNHDWLLTDEERKALDCLNGYVDHPLTFHIRVYAIAERLVIPWLKDLARVKFDRHLDEKLEAKVLADVVELVYSTTSEDDQALRGIVVKTAAARSTELLRDTDFADMSRRVGDFAMDLALRLAPKPMKNGQPRLSESRVPASIQRKPLPLIRIMATKPSFNIFAAELLANLPNLRISGAFSDFTITCDTSTYHVHRLVLSTHSGYFSTLFSSDFKEAKENSINLEDDRSYIVDAMIEALYDGDYAYENDDDLAELEDMFHAKVRTQPEDELESAIRSALARKSSLRTPRDAFQQRRVYALAEKYNIPNLKNLACEHFVRTFAITESSVRDMAETIEYVYDSTPESDRRLRDVVVHVAADRTSEFYRCPEFETMAGNVGEFCNDLAKRLGKMETQDLTDWWDNPDLGPFILSDATMTDADRVGAEANFHESTGASGNSKQQHEPLNGSALKTSTQTSSATAPEASYQALTFSTGQLPIQGNGAELSSTSAPESNGGNTNSTGKAKSSGPSTQASSLNEHGNRHGKFSEVIPLPPFFAKNGLPMPKNREQWRPYCSTCGEPRTETHYDHTVCQGPCIICKESHPGEECPKGDGYHSRNLILVLGSSNIADLKDLANKKRKQLADEAACRRNQETGAGTAKERAQRYHHGRGRGGARGGNRGSGRGASSNARPLVHNAYGIIDPTATIGTHLVASEPPARSAWGNIPSPSQPAQSVGQFSSSPYSAQSVGQFSSSPYSAQSVGQFSSSTHAAPSSYAGPSQPAPSAGPSRPGYTELPMWSYSKMQEFELRVKVGDLSVINRYQMDEYVALRTWRAQLQNWDIATRGPWPHPPAEMVNGRHHSHESMLPTPEMYNFGGGIQGMSTQQSQTQDPSLPPGWSVMLNANGSKYYVHMGNQRISDVHPGLL
ncbi:hypothetical protein FKW77_004415 [Venturia effusa]|uniref:BTB domain-containing protein n=1 Tax=Venturia effusa TaxID=50376 RepID=A0A517KW63_9PEZI|nr:hypothetical protein FKW77_004415 [Venturia effusa]